jgi:hypothetical protein
MIGFFRRIRKKLADNNQYLKYSRYAIGEILLVVIGILIALQVNNWNEERKIDSLEVKVLKEIASDMQEDVGSLWRDIYVENRVLKSALLIREVLDSDQSFHDSLAITFGNLDFNYTHTFLTSGFDNLRNLGFHIIANDSIRKLITRMYEFEHLFLKEKEELAKHRTYEYFSPRYLPYFIRLESSPGGIMVRRHYIPKNFEALKSDKEFDVLLDYIILVKEENLFSLRQMKKKVDVTVSSLNEYLKTISTN